MGEAHERKPTTWRGSDWRMEDEDEEDDEAAAAVAVGERAAAEEKSPSRKVGSLRCSASSSIRPSPDRPIVQRRASLLS